MNKKALMTFTGLLFGAAAWATPEFTYVTDQSRLKIEARNTIYKQYRCTVSYAYFCGGAEANGKTLSGVFFVFPFEYHGMVVDYPLDCPNAQSANRPAIACD